jgi:regulator of RNase E activity RraA
MVAVGKPKTAEMHAGPGFRIRHTIERPAPDLVAALSAFETPAISDLMNRLYTMSASIRCLTDPTLRIAGPACTVKVYPGDNLMVHKSLDVAEPGDVIVVDTGLSGETAALGDLVSTKAQHRGIAGFVVDGMIRDLPGIRELETFPVFARGVTPLGPMHRGPGEINYPVSVGGIVVFPGDIILGDQNGIVVVPRDLAAELLARLASQSEAEADYLAAVRRGEFSNTWVDTIIAQSGALVEPPDTT